jgi:hypothetical protein
LGRKNYRKTFNKQQNKNLCIKFCAQTKTIKKTFTIIEQKKNFFFNTACVILTKLFLTRHFFFVGKYVNKKMVKENREDLDIVPFRSPSSPTVVHKERDGHLEIRRGN